MTIGHVGLQTWLVSREEECSVCLKQPSNGRKECGLQSKTYEVPRCGRWTLLSNHMARMRGEKEFCEGTILLRGLPREINQENYHD